MNYLEEFGDHNYFEHLGNMTTTLESIENYNLYVVYEIVHLYNVYDIRKNKIQMFNLIAHLDHTQLKMLLPTLEKLEHYEFCQVVFDKIKSNIDEKNSN